MWLAACSHKPCQWRLVTTSLPLAEFHFRQHVVETGHQGVVVPIPASGAEREAEIGIVHPSIPS